MAMEGPLLTFYGDDFTGSSAVMEVLAFAGVPTVMFLDVPSPELLARLKGIRAFGIAGIARSRNPAWMEAELPRYLAALKALGAPLLHYKTCSTFNSAPDLGSIGKATEIGACGHRLGLGAAGCRSARHRPLPDVRNAVRGAERRSSPARPASGDGEPPGNADA